MKQYEDDFLGELPKPAFTVDPYPESVVFHDVSADQIKREYEFLRERYPQTEKPREARKPLFPFSLMVPRNKGDTLLKTAPS